MTEAFNMLCYCGQSEAAIRNDKGFQYALLLQTKCFVIADKAKRQSAMTGAFNMLCYCIQSEAAIRNPLLCHK
jgi:hypothetical protein